jgi:hypothetical protein
VHRRRILTEKIYNTPFLEEALNRHIGWVSSRVLGNGIVTQEKREAIKLLLSFFLEELGYEILRMDCDETNNTPENGLRRNKQHS